MKPIYILQEGRRLGPFEPSDVQKLLNTGQLHRDDPAWTEGQADWEALQLVLPKALAGEGDASYVELADRRRASEVERKHRPFLWDLPYSFVYPFRGHGSILLASGTAALVMAGGLAVFGGYRSYGFHSGGGLILGLFLFTICYYASWVVHVIRCTASGDDDLSELPDLAGVHDEMSGPLLQILGTVLGCFAPALIAWELGRQEIVAADWLVPALGVAGLGYLPMAMLATTILGSALAGLNPVVVVPAIVRSLPRYAMVLVFLGGTVAAGWWAADWLNQRLIPLAAGAVVIALVLYLGIVQARLLGLLFKSSPNRLGWFG